MEGGNLLLFVYPNLLSVMEERYMDYRDLASVLNMEPLAVYRRMRGVTGWKLDETVRICEYFTISDLPWLFARFDATL